MCFETSHTPTSLTPGRVSIICACILYKTILRHITFPVQHSSSFDVSRYHFLLFQRQSVFSLHSNQSYVHLNRYHAHKFLSIVFSQRSPFSRTLEIRQKYNINIYIETEFIMLYVCVKIYFKHRNNIAYFLYHFEISFNITQSIYTYHSLEIDFNIIYTVYNYKFICNI